MLPSSSALIFLFVSRALIYWNFVTWNIITRKYIYFSNNFFTKDSRKTTISKSVKTVKKKKNWKSLAWLIIIPFVFPRLFRGCSRGDGSETFAHRKPFGAASNNAHTTMYDTLADSSRSSSSHRASAFCEPSKPTLSPTSVPGVRCRLALSSPLLSSSTFSSIVCQHCFDSSSSRGLFRSAHSSIGQVIFNPVARPFPASFLVSVYTQTRPLPLSMRPPSPSRRGFLARTRATVATEIPLLSPRGQDIAQLSSTNIKRFFSLAPRPQIC